MRMPSSIADIRAEEVKLLKGVFCDIDDTLTWEGRLIPEAFAALARLQDCGLPLPKAWEEEFS